MNKIKIIKCIFEEKSFLNNIKDFIKYSPIKFNDLKKVSEQEQNEIINTVKKAFYKELKINNIYIIGKDEIAFLALIKSSYSYKSNYIMLFIEITEEENDIIRVSLIDATSGEIKQNVIKRTTT